MFSRNYSQIVEVTKEAPNDSSFFTEKRLKFQFLGRLSSALVSSKDAQLTSLDHPRLPLYRKQFQFHRFSLLPSGVSSFTQCTKRVVCSKHILQSRASGEKTFASSVNYENQLYQRNRNYDSVH